jgi:hypothetical protein
MLCCFDALIDVVDMVYYAGAFVACSHVLSSVLCRTKAYREFRMKQLAELDQCRFV